MKALSIIVFICISYAANADYTVIETGSKFYAKTNMDLTNNEPFAGDGAYSLNSRWIRSGSEHCSLHYNQSEINTDIKKGTLFLVTGSRPANPNLSGAGAINLMNENGDEFELICFQQYDRGFPKIYASTFKGMLQLTSTKLKFVSK